MKKRESFNSQWGFILACIGSAVGMGNIWMFPTRVSLYGGGSFLIPYCIFVILIGFTGVIGEMCLGRGTRSGPIDAFGTPCPWCPCHGNWLYRGHGMDLKIYGRNFYRFHPICREY